MTKQNNMTQREMDELQRELAFLAARIKNTEIQPGDRMGMETKTLTKGALNTPWK